MLTPSPTPAIEIKKLSKAFRKTAVLKNVSLSVSRGEVFCLMGPNGAGKTTLVKILCSLILPDSGNFRIDGQINLVLGEERSFYPRLSGRQNLEFFSALYGFSPAQTKTKIQDFAYLLENDSLDKKFQEYSTGTKHRLSLIRSFLNDAEIIFMDEPTRSMDPNGAAQFREQIRRMKEEFQKTIFITTHQCQEAEAVADRIAIMDHGDIKAVGSLADLRQKVQIPMASLNEIFRSLIQKDSCDVHP